jgi:hypothetical protein
MECHLTERAFFEMKAIIRLFIISTVSIRCGEALVNIEVSFWEQPLTCTMKQLLGYEKDIHAVPFFNL